MNVPPSEFQALITDYCALALPNQTVLQVDFFFCQEQTQWQTILLLQQQDQQVLSDLDGNSFCRYDRILPLFLPSDSLPVHAALRDLQEQLSGLRSRVNGDAYQKAQAALETLAHPRHPLAPAYLVEEAGQKGVVNPLGQLIVPARYAHIDTFAFSDPGDASLFLCRRKGHQLNDLDVYDMRGNCIFRQIGSLHPREETLLTSDNGTSSLRKLKSLWVVQQTLDHPFPEDPDFQLVQEVPQRYTRKALYGLGFAESPLWTHCPREETPPRALLIPMAAMIGQRIGCSAEEVLNRLPDYQSFRLERFPLSQRLQAVTKDTPLCKLGLSIRTHHCLVRNGLETVADVLALSEEAIGMLRRSTPEILQELMVLIPVLDKMV